jgi:hypothetical protein
MTTPSKNYDAIFYLFIAVAAISVFTAYIFIATRAFFWQDDFFFIFPYAFGQFPIPDLSTVPFFRPISRELFFYLCFKAFRFESFGYYLVNVITHLISAIAFYLIGVQLNLSRKFALLLAFVYFANAPAFAKMSWISNFQHTSYHLFIFLSIWLALEGVHADGWKKILYLALSNLSWASSLMSNQAGLFFPFALVFILAIDYWQRNREIVLKDAAVFLINSTWIHWLIFLGYVFIIFLPHWQNPDPDSMYSVEVSMDALITNLTVYAQVWLPNAKGYSLMLLIAMTTLTAWFFHKDLKPLLTQQSLLVLGGCLASAGVFYAPFAFLKLQHYANYVTMALLPLYVILFYPFFVFLKASTSRHAVQRLILLATIVALTLAAMPDLSQWRYYLKKAPGLQTKILWNQSKILLPEIPKDVKKVMFVNDEWIHTNKAVSFWQAPSFWAFTGFGQMFSVLYNRSDIVFEVASARPVSSTPDTLYIDISKKPLRELTNDVDDNNQDELTYFSLSLIK